MLVTIDIARHQLEDNRTVDITKIVSNMRQDRRGIIVTKEQYVYIHQVSAWSFLIMPIRLPQCV